MSVEDVLGAGNLKEIVRGGGAGGAFEPASCLDFMLMLMCLVVSLGSLREDHKLA